RAIRTKIRALENEKVEVRLALKEIEGLLEVIESTKSKIKEIKKEKPTKELRSIEDLKAKRAVVETNLVSLTEKQADLTQQFNRYSALKDGFKEVKAYVFKSLLVELSNKATEILGELFEVPA